MTGRTRHLVLVFLYSSDREQLAVCSVLCRVSVTERHELCECSERVQLIGVLMSQYLLSAELHRRLLRAC